MTLTDDLTERLLAKPVAPTIVPRQSNPKDFNRSIEVGKDSVQMELRGPIGANDEGTAKRFLEEEGLDPAQWEATHFRKIEYGDPAKPNESVKVSYKRVAGFGGEERPPIDELIANIARYKAKAKRDQGDSAVLIDLGDMQFGKIDGDGVAGTLTRTIELLNRAADSIEQHRKRFDIGHIVNGWLGDHVEGFSSQGGANVWRTPLTLNEQIRLVRRVMLHGLGLFAPMAEKVSMVAVPGNHGEPQRFAGKGITRYDDSHDTESLIAVSEAAAFNADAFGHVEFFVPETDEMSVVIEAANTTVGHVHGHQFRPGKHFDWWRKQAFHSSGFEQADVLFAGHLHHLLVETDGPRSFVQVPSLESESTWFRHSQGSVGSPGITLSIVRDGQIKLLEVIQ